MTAALEKLKGESAAPQTQEPLDDLNDEGMEGEEEEGACADDEIVEESFGQTRCKCEGNIYMIIHVFDYSRVDFFRA